MPRFTIGSLATGIALALIAVWILHTLGTDVLIRSAVSSGRLAPPGGPEPLAIDPARGTVAIGMEKANDYALDDSFDSSGGLDAATW
jgi:hypothetical protein